MQLQMYPFDRQKCELIIESCEYSTFHFSNLQFLPLVNKNFICTQQLPINYSSFKLCSGYRLPLKTFKSQKDRTATLRRLIDRYEGQTTHANTPTQKAEKKQTNKSRKMNSKGELRTPVLGSGKPKK